MGLEDLRNSKAGRKWHIWSCTSLYSFEYQIESHKEEVDVPAFLKSDTQVFPQLGDAEGSQKGHTKFLLINIPHLSGLWSVKMIMNIQGLVHRNWSSSAWHWTKEILSGPPEAQKDLLPHLLFFQVVFVFF